MTMILSSASQSESSKQSRLMPPETPAQSIVQPDKPVFNVHTSLHSSSKTQLETETIDVSALATLHLPSTSSYSLVDRPTLHGKKSRSGPEGQNKTINKNKRKTYDSEEICSAVKDMMSGMSAWQAAMKWDVPRTTLQNRKKGGFKEAMRPGPSTVLTANEENLLCEWLIELSRRGIPMQKQCLSFEFE
jgi:hypothetical protein